MMWVLRRIVLRRVGGGDRVGGAKTMVSTESVDFTESDREFMLMLLHRCVGGVLEVDFPRWWRRLMYIRGLGR